MPINADHLTALRTGRLASLEAWGSSLKPEDAATLANALKANGTLTTLDLGGNASLGDAGIRSLAPGLREARALSTLGLDGVGLGDGGGREVAAALRSNCLPALTRHMNACQTCDFGNCGLVNRHITVLFAVIENLTTAIIIQYADLQA